VYLLNIKPTDSMHKEVVSFVLKAMAHEKREPRFELPRVHLVDLHNDSRRTSTHIQHQYSSHSLETSSPRTTRSFASIRLDSEVSFSGNVSSLDQLVDMGIVDVQGDSRLPRRRIEDVQQNFSTKPGEENDFERQVKNNRELQESQVKVVAYLCDSPVNDAKALLRLAALYQQSGELQKSKSIYKRAKTIIERELSIDPAGIDYIRCQLAIIDLLEGRFREAEKTFAELEMKLHSTFGDHERTWEVMRWHALAFDVQGQYQKALPKLQQIPVPMEIEISEPFTQATNVTLLTQSTLALVMAHVGEYRRAIEYSGLALSHAEALCARPAIANVKIWTGTDDNEESACIGRMLSAIQSDRANILANVGQYIEAQSINDQAMKGMERYYGSKYVATLECWSLKVHLLALEGKIDEAEQQCQTTLRAMRRDIGKEHPSTLRTLGILVFIYRSQAKWADALQNATYLVDRNRSSHDIGPQHPQTISSMAQLADVYLACGQLVQALSDQITIVGLSEQVLGKDHPITLNYRSDLANIYCNLENWNSAREILFEVFVKQMEQVTQFVTYVRRSHNGETQPLNMSSIKEVCEIFRALRSKGKNYNDIPLLLMSTMHRLGVSERDREDGNLEFARELLEQVVEYREIRLGLDHADTLSSQLDLAMTKRQLSCHQNSTVDLEKLLEVFNRIAHVRQERLGSDHPDTLSARRERSLTKIQLGLIAKAVDEQEEILRSCIRLLGNGHPNTIRSCTDLSIAYHSIGDLKRAETLQLDALKAQLVLYPSPILKEEARKTFNAALEALGLATKGQAETTEADTKNLELSDSEPLALPETPYHPRITSSMACLASIYTEQENFPLAALVQEAVVSQHKLALPDSIYSLTTLESINTLAALNQAQRNYFRAITLYNEVLANAPAHSPLYFASQSFLGSLYFSQDDFANAERVQKKAYEEQCAIAESDADSEARSKNEEALVIASFNLALTKWELGKKGEAKVLMGVARVFAERGLGGEHERTREVVDTLREWEAEDLE
jgi:hypothetical protein